MRNVFFLNFFRNGIPFMLRTTYMKKKNKWHTYPLKPVELYWRPQRRYILKRKRTNLRTNTLDMQKGIVNWCFKALKLWFMMLIFKILKQHRNAVGRHLQVVPVNCLQDRNPQLVRNNSLQADFCFVSLAQAHTSKIPVLLPSQVQQKDHSSLKSCQMKGSWIEWRHSAFNFMKDFVETITLFLS